MPNLPDLSSGRTFLSSPNGYTGGESYRERIRESISNTPRSKAENGTYIPRSIDLSIEKNIFRTVSRYNNPNSKNNDMDNENQFVNQRSQKSARNRQILFYNKSQQSQDNNNNNHVNNQPQQHFDNQENLEQFLSPDNSSKYESEGSTTTENNYPSRRKRFEDNNFASKNNNLDNLNGNNNTIGNEPVFRERIQTARRENATRTPVITPRKNVSYSNNNNTNGNHNNNNNNPINDFNSHENANRTPRNRNSDVNEFPGINSFYEESPRLKPPKSARGNRPPNQSMSLDNTDYMLNESNANTPRNIRTPRTNRLPNHQSMDDYESLRSSSRTNMRDEGTDSPPVPMPRKRDVSTKLLPNDTSDFRIKRVSSSKINLNNTAPSARSSYLPSTQQNLRPRQQAESTGNDVDPNVLERRRMDNDLNQRIIKQIENSPRIKTAIVATEEIDNTGEDLFFKSRRREASSGRRQNTRLDIGMDPNSILESKPRNQSSKNRISFE